MKERRKKVIKKVINHIHGKSIIHALKTLQGPEDSVLGMGPLGDHPDFQDYTAAREMVKPMLQQLNLEEPAKFPTPPLSVDLRKWCSPIRDQGTLGSSTAHAALGCVEYFERRAFGRKIDASALFLYKVTRKMLGLTGDVGAYLKTTLEALRFFGVLPESYWPYVIEDFDKEPPGFCYAYAYSYRNLKFFQQDTPNTPKDQLLNQIKVYLWAGLPALLATKIYNSIFTQSAKNGKVPHPCRDEQMMGAHPVVAVGYDDRVKTKNVNCGVQTTGALLIRNSWGTGWGDKGYGWLPYDYLLKGYAFEWWTLIKKDWVETGKFGLPKG